MRSPLQKSLADISSRCTECGLCLEDCGFLQRRGLPRQLADNYEPGDRACLSIPFECSLCGLCSAVCPEGIEPDKMFMEMRREAVDRDADFSCHYRLLRFERLGTSRRFSLYALPDGCDTVFFPGCALPGTRPDKTLKIFELLRIKIPSLGIVMDCCTKPSHDLGRKQYFLRMFGELKAYLLEHRIKTVLVACPNCHKVFSNYGEGLETKTVYEVLAGENLQPYESLEGYVVTIHDPCAVRCRTEVHSAARSILSKMGLAIKEMKHNREKTLCCGEGGNVGCLSPELAGRWGSIRKAEAKDKLIVTYCAGCSSFLGRVTSTIHLLDLIFEPGAAISGRTKASRAPFTYLNRLRLKRCFAGIIRAGISRERPQLLP